MEMPQVRPYSPADRDDVLALAPRLTEGVATWRDPDAVLDAVVGWVRGSIDAAGEPDHLVLVATADGRVVGFVTAEEHRHWSGGSDAYIGELVVDPTAEGHGIGRALVDAVHEWAKVRDLGAVTLETGAANARARGFYAAIGFAEEDVRLTRQL
ncbi:MAG TPA: GNAT family N-acetyltransferase [Nocardioidaceae bacterium]|nr:GNAT family N-acetyltransferase [Nocardioidaceae bacterium]